MYIGAVAFIMLDSIPRIWRMFSDGSKPIDWAILLVDVFVLGVIILFEAPEYLHKRKVRKIMLGFQPLLEKGERLKREVPRSAQGSGTQYVEGQEKINAWTQALHRWTEEMDAFLRNHPRAVMVFKHKIEPSLQDQVILYDQSGAFQITANHRVEYLRLVAELTNLYRITEKPEAYFD